MTVYLAVEDPLLLTGGFDLLAAGARLAVLEDGTSVLVYLVITNPARTEADVYMQRMGASGALLGGPVRINSTVPGAQGGIPDGLQVAALGTGGFVVSWTDNSALNGDLSGNAIKAQVFSAGGQKVGGEIQVNTTTAEGQEDPSVTALAGGGFVIAWEDKSGVDDDVRFQLFSATGAKVGPERLANQIVASDQFSPSVSGLADGGFLMVWSDTSGTLGDTEFSGVVAQRFDSAGVRQGSEVLVNTSTAGRATSAATASLAGGGYVVIWLDDSPPGSKEDVRYRVFNADGQALGPDMVVEAPDVLDATAPSVSALADGGFAITWTAVVDTVPQDRVIKVATFDALGNPVVTPFIVGEGGFQLPSDVAGEADGDLIVGWSDFDNPFDPTRADVYRQRLGRFEELSGTPDADDPLFGTAARDFIIALAGADRVFGGAGGDWIEGGDGEDVLSGDGGNDLLFGGQQSDMLFGGDGDDRLEGSDNDGDTTVIGNDTLDGGAGVDTASYRNALNGLTADLAAPDQNINEAVGDSYFSIENLEGSRFEDTLRGNAGANVLSGREDGDVLFGRAGNDTLNGDDGSDTLNGEAGADRLLGGDGFDYASYSTAPAGVVADLASPGSNTGVAAGDSYHSIEALIGSGFDDTLRGGSGAEILSGKVGDDVLEGRGGADFLNGESGRDTASYFRSGAGVTVNLNTPEVNTGDASGDGYLSIENLNGSNFDDELSGDAVANTINGYGGDDRVIGGEGNDVLYGWTGADLLEGESGADTLYGGQGGDSLFGGAGNDLLFGGIGADALYGGTGLDRASYAGATAGVKASLLTPATNTGEALGDSYSSIENVTGSNFADTLQGDGNANAINGGGGGDVVGGRGGNDVLTGGLGADDFLFDTAPNGTTNFDRITDFNAAADTIRLENAVYTVLPAGGLAPEAFRQGTAATDADDRIIYNQSSGELFYDPDGVGGAAQVKFAEVTDGLVLTSADFMVV